jgi:hypothetical protein
MIKTIDEYLEKLRIEMENSDPALVQDALADATEHLHNALAAARESQPDVKEEDALQSIIEEYGTPDETAAAYAEVERRTMPGLSHETKRPRSLLGSFFGVYADARAWGGLIYLFIAFVTGVVYFTWAVTGVSLSVSFSIFIFGLPFVILFLLSIRGLALLEGRLVEALLGIRMPRRPVFSYQSVKWLERLKGLLLDKHVWLMLLYMVIQFVLGTIYFVVTVTVLSLGLSLIAWPFYQTITNDALIIFGDVHRTLPVWAFPLVVLSGFLLLTTYMHLVKVVSQFHGRMAKWMLVAE